MLYAGITSVTFRNLKPIEIVKLTSDAGLKGIEWGGDIHVPVGDLINAKEVKKITEESGMSIAGYGSYYRMGGNNKDKNEDKGKDIDKDKYKDDKDYFKYILETAQAINAPTIRVWAGTQGSLDTDSFFREKIIKETFEICEIAKKSNITISLEFHGGTLTDTGSSALQLLKEVNHPSLRTYWQTLDNINYKQRLESLKCILPWLSNIHVFHWEEHNRLPLEEGMDVWRSYFELIKTDLKDHYAMLEFVKDDDTMSFS